jgi:hypothetical protein
MHADVAITIVFGGFVALTALAAAIVLLRSRQARAETRDDDRSAVR